MKPLTIIEMRNHKVVQAHHWRAAQWFATLGLSDRRRREIARECRPIGSADAGAPVNAYRLLRDVVERGGSINAETERLVGVLRECLNLVSRYRAQCQASQPSDLFYHFEGRIENGETKTQRQIKAESAAHAAFRK